MQFQAVVQILQGLPLAGEYMNIVKKNFVTGLILLCVFGVNVFG